MLASRAGLKRYAHYAMYFDSPSLRAVLLSVHVPLREAIRGRLTPRRSPLARLTAREWPRLHGRTPRIGVAGLNPHAGEGGKFGNEARRRRRLFFFFCPPRSSLTRPSARPPVPAPPSRRRPAARPLPAPPLAAPRRPTPPPARPSSLPPLPPSPLSLSPPLRLAADCWGATFTVIKDILRNIAPEPFIFLRFTLAGVALVILALARGGLPRAVLRPGLILGALVFVGYWKNQTHGLMLISPSRSAFLTGLYVVLVPFCDRLLYRARIDARAWLGSALAVVGTTMLIGGVDARPSWGDALTFICAICFAIHVVLSAKYSAATSAVALAAVQVMVVGVAAAPPSLFAPRPRMTAHVAIVIVFTAIVTTALAFVALMWGQARVTATEAAVMLAFEPVSASCTSILLHREPLTLTFAAGAALILAAMILSQLRTSPRRIRSRRDRHPERQRRIFGYASGDPSPFRGSG